MNEEQIKEEIDAEPFKPLRLHLISGKTVDVLRADAFMPLRDRLLLFLNMSKSGRGAETYNIISYAGIERIEQRELGKRMTGKRKTA